MIDGLYIKVPVGVDNFRGGCVERSELGMMESVEDLANEKDNQFDWIFASNPPPHGQAYFTIDSEGVDDDYQLDER